MINVDKMYKKVENRFGVKAPVTEWFSAMCEQYRQKGANDWNDSLMLASYKATMNEDWIS